MILAASSSSAIRTSNRCSLISGRSIAGLRMSPSSPPVHVTSTEWTPSALYLATVAAPLELSSSGWAWTWSRASGSVMPEKLSAPATDPHRRWSQAAREPARSQAGDVPLPQLDPVGQGLELELAGLLVLPHAPPEELAEVGPSLVGTAGDDLVAGVELHTAPRPV